VKLDRQHLRLPVENRVFIESESAEAGETGGKVTICKTLDVSVNGMQISLDHELPVGAFLHLGVEASHPEPSDNTFFLVAAVRWCRPQESEDGPWLAGLELQEARGSDIARWGQLIAGLEN